MTVKQCLRVLFLMLTVCCMVVIFGFSAQDGPQTSSVSTQVTQAVVSVANVGTVRIDPNPLSLPFQNVHHLVRKTAHFSIYCALAFCMCGFFVTFAWRHSRVASLTLALCFLYAGMDEIHQSFVAGRGPAFTDVLIDTGGALLGMIVLLSLANLIKRKQKDVPFTS